MFFYSLHSGEIALEVLHIPGLDVFLCNLRCFELGVTALQQEYEGVSRLSQPFTRSGSNPTLAGRYSKDVEYV